MMHIIKNRNIWYSISGICVFVSIILFFAWGLRLGIDFTGGSLLEISFEEQAPDIATFRETMQELHLEGLQIATTQDEGFLLRFQPVDEEKHQEILAFIQERFVQEGELGFEQRRFESIGPVIGNELKRKSVIAITLVLIAIILYVAWAFRKISQPISSYYYGLTTVIALFQDIIITIGIFVILGRFFGVEVNVAFVAALLTILGYSVNDTIVVFDRVRENVLKRQDKAFDDVVNDSVYQTLWRSINTSMTTLLVLGAVFFFGGSTLQAFVMALIIGIAIGTYSSIFIASPLLVSFVGLRKQMKQWQNK